MRGCKSHAKTPGKESGKSFGTEVVVNGSHAKLRMKHQNRDLRNSS